MKIVTPAEGLILLPGEVRDKLKGASAAELKVLIYLYAQKEAETPELSAKLGITPAEAEAAMAFWRGAGLLTVDESGSKKAVAPGTPLYKSYDSETISDKMKEEAFKCCCDITAEKLGKLLTKNEISSLLYLYDYVNLPSEMICGVVEYCVSKGKKSMQYIMNTALSMYQDDGIDSYEKFELYLTRLEEVHSLENKVRKLCGFGERELTGKEKAFLHHWFEEWELSYEMVHLAFEKTVDSLGKVSLSYMNSMLKRWYEEGYATPEDVAVKDQKPFRGDGSAAGYGDGDEFFEAALKKGMED